MEVCNVNNVTLFSDSASLRPQRMKSRRARICCSYSPKVSRPLSRMTSGLWGSVRRRDNFFVARGLSKVDDSKYFHSLGIQLTNFAQPTRHSALFLTTKMQDYLQMSVTWMLLGQRDVGCRRTLRAGVSVCAQRVGGAFQTWRWRDQHLLVTAGVKESVHKRFSIDLISGFARLLWWWKSSTCVPRGEIWWNEDRCWLSGCGGDDLSVRRLTWVEKRIRTVWWKV